MTTITRGWPPKRRGEQARRCKRHKPWRFSTGPRSAAGKKISSQNGLKHGYRSAHYRELCGLLRIQRLFVQAVREHFSMPRLSSMMPCVRPAIFVSKTLPRRAFPPRRYCASAPA